MKVKLKIKLWKIIVGILVLSFFAIVMSVRRDMNLNIDLLRESLNKLPDLAFENITMSREVSGDVWDVHIPLVSQESMHLKLQSLDITRTLHDNAGQWYFFGQEGIYSHDEQAASINGLTGTFQDDKGHNLKLLSPVVNWQAGQNALVFNDGLTVYDNEFKLTGNQASIDQKGVILLQHGGVIEWGKSSNE